MLEPLILIVIVLILFIVFLFFKKIAYFIINSIIGILALFGFNQIFNDSIIINFWSILISGIGGAIGFLIVIVLHLFGLAF